MSTARGGTPALSDRTDATPGAWRKTSGTGQAFFLWQEMAGREQSRQSLATKRRRRSVGRRSVDDEVWDEESDEVWRGMDIGRHVTHFLRRLQPGPQHQVNGGRKSKTSSGQHGIDLLGDEEGAGRAGMDGAFSEDIGRQVVEQFADCGVIGGWWA